MDLCNTNGRCPGTFLRPQRVEMSHPYPIKVTMFRDNRAKLCCKMKEAEVRYYFWLDIHHGLRQMPAVGV